MKIRYIALLALAFSSQTLAAQWKLSHEVEISDTRKVCVYTDKAGNTKQVEQAKTQYCRTYI